MDEIDRLQRELEREKSARALQVEALTVHRDSIQRELDEARSTLVMREARIKSLEHMNALRKDASEKAAVALEKMTQERDTERERVEKAEALRRLDDKVIEKTISSLQEHNATLTEERDAAIAANVKTATLDKYADIISKENSQLEAIATLQRENATLREALKDLLYVYGEQIEEHYCICGSNDLGIHSSVCRRSMAAQDKARAALTPPAQEPKL